MQLGAMSQDGNKKDNSHMTYQDDKRSQAKSGKLDDVYDFTRCLKMLQGINMNHGGNHKKNGNFT